MVLPPSRPDTWQLSAIARLISGLPRDRPVAVLGSTPEFRDLLAELDFANIHLFERNERFHRLVSKERVYQNQEHVVWGDWLQTLHSPPDKYTAILSDLTSGNVDYADRGRFYSGVARALQRDGIYIDRVLSHSVPHERLDRLSVKYDKLPFNLNNINSFSCEFLFCSELLSLRGVVDSTKFYDILKTQLRTERLQKFLESCPLITPLDCVWWYGRPWSDLAYDYEKHLATIECLDEPDNSPYAHRARLLVSRTRAKA
jgi:hypothetical protein